MATNPQQAVVPFGIGEHIPQPTASQVPSPVVPFGIGQHPLEALPAPAAQQNPFAVGQVPHSPEAMAPQDPLGQSLMQNSPQFQMQSPQQQQMQTQQQQMQMQQMLQMLLQAFLGGGMGMGMGMQPSAPIANPEQFRIQ